MVQYRRYHGTRVLYQVAVPLVCHAGGTGMHVYPTIWYLVRWYVQYCILEYHWYHWYQWYHWYGTGTMVPWYSSTIIAIPCGTRTLLQEEVNIISLNSRSTVVSLHMLPAKHLVDAACRLFLARQFSGRVVLEVVFASGNCDMANEPQTSADRGPRPFT
jgi:hypothetical protein